MTRWLPMSLAASVTLIGLLALTLAQVRAAAPETEIREFAIEVGGKTAGQYVMTITKQDDGVLSAQCNATITVKHLFGTYRYTFQGVEHWKDGRLFQLASRCDDDGTKFDVSATADPQGLRLKINGRERLCPVDAWTTTYWKLPDARFHNNKITLLDADTGKEYVAHLKYLNPPEQMTVGGKKQNCYHFQVTGGPMSPCDLWYDGQHRLVRQEFTDQGKRVVFVLSAVRRGS